MNGLHPALVSLGRAPAINATVPLRPRFIAALSVSHGDRRMRGRYSSTPDLTPRDQQPNPAPSEIGAGAGGIQKGNDVRIRCDIEMDRAGRQFLRTVAASFESKAVPWPGVPP